MSFLSISKIIANMTYPPGSIYKTTKELTAENLSQMFGGTWLQIETSFLMGVDDTHTVLNKYGYFHSSVPVHSHEVSHGSHTMSPSISSHSHYDYGKKMAGKGSDYDAISQTLGGNGFYTSYNGEHTHTIDSITNTSSSDDLEDGAYANLPPYYVIYIWRRIS